MDMPLQNASNIFDARDSQSYVLYQRAKRQLLEMALVVPARIGPADIGSAGIQSASPGRARR
jgi:hypothetical protein